MLSSTAASESPMVLIFRVIVTSPVASWRRHGDNNFAVPLDPPPERSAKTIRQELRRRNQMGLLDIGGWHASTALLKVALELLEGLLLDRRGLLHSRGNGLTGQVVLGWSQA